MKPKSKKKNPRSRQPRWEHDTHPIVVNALKEIAKANGTSYERVKHQFAEEQDEQVTLRFWEIVRAKYGNQYNTVDLCPDCGEFYMGFELSGNWERF